MTMFQYDTFWRAKIINDYEFNPPTTGLVGLVGLTKSLKDIYLDNNTIFLFGSNYYKLRNNINIDKNTNKNVPTKINGIQIQSFSCGEDHTVLIAQTLRVHPEDINNNVWVSGSNNRGQLGLGDYIDRNAKTLPPGYPWKEEPTKINNIKAKYVSCGDFYTMLIAQTLRVHPEDMNNNVWSTR